MKKKFDIRDSIFEAIFKYFKKNKNCYFLTADQGSFGYKLLERKFPSKVINVGIAEQNMVGIAAGLAYKIKLFSFTLYHHFCIPELMSKLNLIVL